MRWHPPFSYLPCDSQIGANLKPLTPYTCMCSAYLGSLGPEGAQSQYKNQRAITSILWDTTRGNSNGFDFRADRYATFP